MSERVIVTQDKNFQTHFLAQNPENEDHEELQDIFHIHELTPYGMLLASLAACTAIVVTAYAPHPALPLDAIRVAANSARVIAED